MAQPKYLSSGTVESKKIKSLQQKALEAPEYKESKQARSPEEHQNERRKAKEARQSRWSREFRGSEQLGSWDPKDEDFDIHDDSSSTPDDTHENYQFHDDAFYDEIDAFYEKYYELEREEGFQEDIYFDRESGEFRLGTPPGDPLY